MRQKACLLFFVVLVSAAIFNYGAVPASERAALIALYNSTDGDHWYSRNGWKTPPLAADGFAMPGTEKNWSGVSVSGDTVTGISFSNSHLSGPIPAELGNLSNLTDLDFSNNRLSGSIPPELGNLSKLSGLFLTSNHLSGAIPATLGKLSNLALLCLTSNQLSGSIPSQLGNLSNLNVFNVSENHLSGVIPSTLGNLSNLYLLYLSDNCLSGEIPSSLTNLTNVDYMLLSISYNCLHTNDSTLRDWLYQREPFWEAYQEHCDCQNTITVTAPDGGENWAIGSSQIITWTTTGTVGNVKIEYSTDYCSNWSTITPSTANTGNYSWTIPNTPCSRCYLRIEEAVDGNPSDTGNDTFKIYVYGPIPLSERAALIALYNSTDGDHWWENSGWKTPPLAADGFAMPGTEGSWQGVTFSGDNVIKLYLEGNYLRGSIPPELGNLSKLSRLYLYNNQLSGIIPSALGNLSNLQSLDLSHNFLFGEIPSSFTNLALIFSPNFHISYNCLYTNDSILRAWLKRREFDWETHQDKCRSQPVISLSPTRLNFGSTTAGAATAPQTVIIKNIGAGTLAWTAAGDTSWLNVSPVTGSGPGTITTAINPSGLPIGTFTGAITVSDPNAGNSPLTIPVTLKIYDNGGTATPFGEFATPLNGSWVSGSIPVTGWALDNIEVKKVEIFNGADYIGDAVFVEGARPDVEQAYPDYPQNYKAGWGYLLLTNFLPNGGDGTCTLYAKATDAEGNQVTLGSKKIICRNAYAVTPFGAIDTPTPGGIASGKDFINWGWVLTPQPFIIPTDGSTIDIWIDGEKIGNPTYDIYREDIAALFPGYANSNGAGGEFHLDTTYFKNGVHAIHWTASDSFGNSAGIGSRYFTIMNSGSSQDQESNGDATDIPFAFTLKDLESLPGQSTAPGKVIKGYGKDEEAPGYELFTDEDGINRVSIKELERIEIQMGENLSDVRGYMIIDGRLRPLPIGSTLDKKAGKFYWQPGPGFYGKYDFVFLIKDSGGQWSKKMIEINIDAET